MLWSGRSKNSIILGHGFSFQTLLYLCNEITLFCVCYSYVFKKDLCTRKEMPSCMQGWRYPTSWLMDGRTSVDTGGDAVKYTGRLAVELTNGWSNDRWWSQQGRRFGADMFGEGGYRNSRRDGTGGSGTLWRAGSQCALYRWTQSEVHSCLKGPPGGSRRLGHAGWVTPGGSRRW